MKAAALLGLRLAIGTGGQRSRSLMTVTASAVGTAVLLLVWGIAHSQVGTTTAYNSSEVALLMAGTIGMVGLPVLIFVATIARLSARVRDRRLSSLRLLGLSAAQTRAVAATEVGVASVAGAALGAGIVIIVTTLFSRLGVSVGGLSGGSMAPPLLAWFCVLVAVPAVAVITAALPQRLSPRGALVQVRQGDDASVRLVRLVPLVVGFALCWATRSPLLDQQGVLSYVEVAAILVGILLMGVGMILVIPVFVGLMAALVLRLGRGPLMTIVGRRIQTQPAGATRVIAALMLGLFLVVAARGVVTAFLSTGLYIETADFVERDQTAEVTASSVEATATGSALRSVDGVRTVASFPVLYGGSVDPSPGQEDEVTVVVASCAELAGPDDPLEGCSNDTVSLVGEPFYYDTKAEEISVQSVRGWAPGGPAVTVSLRDASTIDPADFVRAVGAFSGLMVIVVPPDTPGIDGLLARTDHVLVAHAGPGRFLYDRVHNAGYRVDTLVDLEGYDFVQGMLAVVWTLAAVIISIGLLTFTIAGIDRALSRRRELTALRLLGTPGSLLRWAQWLEVAIPTVFGSVLAILAGGYAGVTYLQLDQDQVKTLTPAYTLAVLAAVASIVLAWVTTLGTTARLDPEHIRAE